MRKLYGILRLSFVVQLSRLIMVFIRKIVFEKIEKAIPRLFRKIFKTVVLTLLLVIQNNAQRRYFVYAENFIY